MCVRIVAVVVSMTCLVCLALARDRVLYVGGFVLPQSDMRQRSVRHTLGSASSLSHTSKKNRAKSDSDKGSPLILIRSRTAHRWGDVYSPSSSASIYHPS